jgi:hypothetical protein
MLTDTTYFKYAAESGLSFENSLPALRAIQLDMIRPAPERPFSVHQLSGCI